MTLGMSNHEAPSGWDGTILHPSMVFGCLRCLKGSCLPKKLVIKHHIGLSLPSAAARLGGINQGRIWPSEKTMGKRKRKQVGAKNNKDRFPYHP